MMGVVPSIPLEALDPPAVPAGVRVLPQTLITVPPTATAPDQSTRSAAGPPDVPQPSRRRRGLLMVLLAIMLIGVNLRITITSLGALLDQVAADLHFDPFALGALTALPAAAF